MNVLPSRRTHLVPTGVTLIELLVVLVIFGAMAGLVGLSARDWAPTPVEDAAPELASARRKALVTGTSLSEVVAVDGRQALVTVLPDGQVIGGAAIGVDPLTGRTALPSDSLPDQSHAARMP